MKLSKLPVWNETVSLGKPDAPPEYCYSAYGDGEAEQAKRSHRSMKYYTK
jgi:hypothetical protein